MHWVYILMIVVIFVGALCGPEGAEAQQDFTKHSSISQNNTVR